MKRIILLTGARLRLFKSPLVTPVELRPGVVVTSRETLLVGLETDEGRVAWGEAAPLPGFSSDTLDAVVGRGVELARELRERPLEVSGDFWLDRLMAVADGLPSLEFAIETAARPIVAADVAIGATVRTAALLQGGPEAVADRARHLVDRGFRCLKVKVGRADVAEDVAMLAMVRRTAGHRILLRADANCAWSWSEAVRFAEGVRQLDLEFIEEPLADSALLPDLYRETGLKTGLDESAGQWATAQAPVMPGYPAAVVVKPTLHGRRSHTLMESARRAAAKVVLSACYESGVGTAAVARKALETGPEPAPVGIGTLAWLEDDGLETKIALDRPELTAAEISEVVIRPSSERLLPIDEK